MGLTLKESLDNVIETASHLESLGFTIHPDKSKFIPSQVIAFLGFVIDSVLMKVYLTVERKAKLKEACLSLLTKSRHTISYVAKVIGLITASFPGVKFGPSHFRDLESCKTEAVKCNKGNYDSHMSLSQAAKIEVQWWIQNIDTADNEIYHKNPSLSLTTDASKSGWEATMMIFPLGSALS